MTSKDYTEDIAEILLDHFPNARRMVLEEMTTEISKLIDESYLAGYDDGVGSWNRGKKTAQNLLKETKDNEG